MFSHLVVGASDIDASKTFYDAIFTAIGGKEGFADPKGRVIYMHGGAVFMISKPIDGNPATFGNGSTVGFAMESPAQADAWHKAGVDAGGTSIEDAPGERPGSGMYLAYLRDPSGNKLCGLHQLG